MSRRLVVLALSYLCVCVLLIPAASAGTHVVQRGETLTAIAAKYGLDVSTLARANKLRDRDVLRRGQKLEIPVSAEIFVEHRVVRGESLATIARKYRCSVADLRAHNSLPDPDHIVIGQVLQVPVKSGGRSSSSGSSSRSRDDDHPQLSAHVREAIDDTKVRAGHWQHIVIHHSATREGSGKGMDRYHREERHMENGLAYHFVIGNGHGMRDGEIYIGARWTKQLPGGHLAIEALNQVSLGICLVGDFEKRAPTRRQLDSLEALIRALQKKTAPKSPDITSHRKIHPKHTKCPGKHFPLDAFLQRLKRS